MYLAISLNVYSFYLIKINWTEELNMLQLFTVLFHIWDFKMIKSKKKKKKFILLILYLSLVVSETKDF